MDNAISDSLGASLDDSPNEVTDSAGGESFIFREPPEHEVEPTLDLPKGRF